MEKNHLEILLEDMSSKFDLVLEAHGVLRKQIEDLRQEVREGDAESRLLIRAVGQRVDRVEKNLSDRIDAVEKKLGDRIDALAADLSAHRRDTEAHFGVSKVCEPEGA